MSSKESKRLQVRGPKAATVAPGLGDVGLLEHSLPWGQVSDLRTERRLKKTRPPDSSCQSEHAVDHVEQECCW